MYKPVLGIPQNTIEILQKYNFSFQKKFGQNFLIDTHVLDKIIRAADINKEDMVLEDGKYYPMMAAKFLGKDAYGTVRNAGKEDIADLFESRIACKFGPLLLEQRHPVLKQYLLSQQKQKQKIQKNLKANARQNVAARTEELSRELMDIERALEFFAGKESGL